jgi:hypothetical protein
MTHAAAPICESVHQKEKGCNAPVAALRLMLVFYASVIFDARLNPA